MIDGCSLKLCVATHSVASFTTAPQIKLNEIARLFRDGSIRKYQFTFAVHTASFPSGSLHQALVPICTPLFISHHSLFSPPCPSSSLPLLYSHSPFNPLSPPLFIFPYFSAPFSLLPPHSLFLYHTLYSPFLLLIPLSLSFNIYLLHLSPHLSLLTLQHFHSSISLSFYNFLFPNHIYALSLSLSLSLTLYPLPSLSTNVLFLPTLFSLTLHLTCRSDRRHQLVSVVIVGFWLINEIVSIL